MDAQTIKAQREIIEGYYIRISKERPSIEQILDWLENDLQTIRMDDLVLDAENIIKDTEGPYDVSSVKCCLCNHTTQVNMKATKAYAIKDPNDVIQFSSIRSEEIICITDFEELVQEYGKDEFWIDLEKLGYRCVPVEITEIKTNKL